jgi:hypothetical protein
MMPSDRSMIFRAVLIILVSSHLCLVSNALSSPTAPEIVPRDFIQLTNPIDASQDRLPASWVQSWPTWILDNDGKLSKIPDSDGFVAPSCIDELWQPVDLKQPELRLALGLHVYVV